MLYQENSCFRQSVVLSEEAQTLQNREIYFGVQPESIRGEIHSYDLLTELQNNENSFTQRAINPQNSLPGVHRGQNIAR